MATIQQALAAADSLSLYLMILLGAALGLRRGEMAALMWEDIDFDEETVSIGKSRVSTKRKVIEKAPKSKAGIRTFSVGHDVANAVREADEDAASKLNQSLFSTAMPISHPPVTI